MLVVEGNDKNKGCGICYKLNFAHIITNFVKTPLKLQN